MPIVRMKSKIHDYDVNFENSPDFITKLASLPKSFFVVDENVWEIYSGSLLKPLKTENMTVFPINEELKSLQSVQRIYDSLITRPEKKNLNLISIGGGILQDITGFVASTLYRGINWIFVPTTFLSQADSCIGSKTSLNYRGYKNILGTFYPPKEIYIHSPFLNSLQPADYYSGLGEVLKLHIMGGTDLINEYLELSDNLQLREKSAVAKATFNAHTIKKSYMENDEFDTGRRNLLNYGHDFGHAIESVSKFSIPHGQAVVLGMLLSNFVAHERKLLTEEKHVFLKSRLLMPTFIDRSYKNKFDPAQIVAGMKLDKKRIGKGLVLILINDEYEMKRVDDLTENEVAKAIKHLNDIIETAI